MRWTALDGGLMGFDRARGLNMLIADERTAAVRRRAPRSLQIGLLTPCNLSCSFCYRDRKAPSRLDRAFLVELLQQCDRWGVLEVAFGGGEPLLFDGFEALVEELHATTGLGINVTTNGMLLERALVERLRGKVGEWRVSIYPENNWQATLARLAGESIGVNWIVTPANVHEVEARVRDFRARGARNVLLLGYKGSDSSLLLDDAGLATLRAQLARLDDERVRLDICWYPRFPDLPHLFARTDCGAGDDILVITADRAVQACSFADHRVPFETFAELQTIYRAMRVARPVANTGGCTRELFTIDTRRHVSGRVLEGDGVWTWHARASSNSGAYTLLARFRTEDRAREAKAELDETYQAHLDYVTSEEGEERDDYYGPTQPLKDLAKKYGFEWPADDGFAWEGDSFGDREEADALEIERLGKHVLVYLGYGQQIGAGGIEQVYTALGADTILHTETPFHFVVTATSKKAADDAQQAIEALDVEVAGDDDEADEADDATYRIDCVNSKGETVSLRFPSTIGGIGDSAKVLLALARVKGLTFELQTAAGAADAVDDDDGDPPPVMLEDDDKQRFWEVSVRRSGGAVEVLSRFGKIGAAGQTRVKTFTTADEAQAEVERMIAEKQKQGFR